jgi:hypothetical protein
MFRFGLLVISLMLIGLCSARLDKGTGIKTRIKRGIIIPFAD